jgi:predicted membrane protein
MLMVLGALISALVGMLLIGFSYSGVNTTSWGTFSAANIPFFAGVLLVVFALGGSLYKALNR